MTVTSERPRDASSLGTTLLGKYGKLIREVFLFSAVGGTAFLIDTGTYYLLRSGALGVLQDSPMKAHLIAATIATIFAWLGNRLLTYRNRSRMAAWKEFQAFALVNVIGILIGQVCVGISHYVLGFDDLRSDFIALYVVGFALGTLFRFAAYRWWIFPDRSGH